MKHITDNPNELFIVVDKNDNILGYKTRKECHQDKNLVHRAVGVVINNDKGEILLQKRSKTKDLYPSFFTISASGHVTKGQTYIKAAEREVFEELGINLPLRFVKIFLNEMEIEKEMATLFESKSNGPFKTNRNEIEYVKFFKKEEIPNMRDYLTPGAINTFKQLQILL